VRKPLGLPWNPALSRAANGVGARGRKGNRSIPLIALAYREKCGRGMRSHSSARRQPKESLWQQTIPDLTPRIDAVRQGNSDVARLQRTASAGHFCGRAGESSLEVKSPSSTWANRGVERSGKRVGLVHRRSWYRRQPRGTTSALREQTRGPKSEASGRSELRRRRRQQGLHLSLGERKRARSDARVMSSSGFLVIERDHPKRELRPILPD
jgi:hypothetical protein